LEILTTKLKGFSSENGEGNYYVDPLIDRPVLEVSAQASYAHLLDFLHGLEDLSFYVAVMKFNIYSDFEINKKKREGNRTPSGLLFVSFEISI